MIVINLFGGPGTGKSSTAADLFALMKWNGYNVELVSEYAKKVTWEGHSNILRDQIYLLAKQNRQLERLREKVDYVITDSPLLLCKLYASDDYYDHFAPLVNQVFESYNNVNVMLKRKKEYVPIGRSQTEDEARQLDDSILNMLNQDGYGYSIVDADINAKNVILNLLKAK